MLGLDGVDLVDAALMASALKLAFQPSLDHLGGLAGSGDALAQAQDVGIVVQAAVLGGEVGLAGRSADAGDLVGRDRDADARAADQDAALMLATMAFATASAASG